MYITEELLILELSKIEGVSTDQVRGVAVEVQAQTAFRQGVTSSAEIVFTKPLTFFQYGQEYKNTAHVSFGSHPYGMQDDFDYDDVRDGEQLTHAQVRDLFTEDAIRMMKDNGWIILWGNGYDDNYVEVQWEGEGEDLFFGENSDT